jgi:UDP-glucose 4-epimerase
LLDAGHRVVALDNLSTGRRENIEPLLARDGFSFVQDTVRNEPVVARLASDADVVYHLASAVGVNLVVHRPSYTIEETAFGSEVVLKCALTKNTPVFLASSSEAYGKGVQVPMRETDDLLLGPPDKARWSYACAKLLDEFLALAYYREHGLPVVVGRFFNTVGPRQTGRWGMVLPNFVQQALHGGPIIVYGDGEQTRCFVFVGDVVGALIKLMQRPEAHGLVFNIGSTDEISINQLAQRVRAICCPAAAIEHVPYDQAYAAGFEDLRRRVPDISRIRNLIGFAPTLTIDGIIQRMLEHYKRGGQ